MRRTRARAGLPPYESVGFGDLRPEESPPAMNTTTAQPEGSSVTAEAASLEFREATKRYPGAEKSAVEALSLEVPAGEICVLVGPSGCGKTTAMRMVNRMIEISDGDILVGGESVRSKAPAQLR